MGSEDFPSVLARMYLQTSPLYALVWEKGILKNKKRQARMECLFDIVCYFWNTNVTSILCMPFPFVIGTSYVRNDHFTSMWVAASMWIGRKEFIFSQVLMLRMACVKIVKEEEVVDGCIRN